MDGIASDKVNIHVGGGEGGGGGGYAAAMIAALGNRNQGNDTAGLIAALGNRNEKDYGPLLAMLANRRDDDGHSSLWPILLLALMGRRGFGGDDGDCHGHSGGVSPAQAALLQTLLEGQSDLRASVPQTALETQGVVQSSASNVKDAVQNSLIASLAATAGVKDAVQNGFTLTGRDIAAVNQNVSSQGCQTRETVEAAKTEILQAISTNRIDDLRDQLAEERHSRRVRDVEVSVSQNVTQIQAQAQEQRQRQSDSDRLFSLFSGIANQLQAVRMGQDIVNLGTMTASGTQAAANTQVR